MSDTISNLSDAGWAGTLVCGGLLVLLRLLRGKLVALEQQASAKLAAVLTQQADETDQELRAAGKSVAAIAARMQPPQLPTVAGVPKAHLKAGLLVNL